MGKRKVLTLLDFDIFKELVVSKNERVWQDPWHFVAFGFGLGQLPKVPGTWGTLFGFVFYYLFLGVSSIYYLIFILLAFIFGVWLCERVSNDLGVHDHSGIVWDEIVGLMITLLWVPPVFSLLCIGFCLFRVFDILKPWPISFVDKHVKGGLGIMIDDVLAAIPAWCLLQIIIHVFY